MCSICKIITFVRCSFLKQFVIATRIYSNTCDSGDKNGDSSIPEESKKETHQPSCCCSDPSDYNPSTPTLYDCRKYGHCLPSSDVCPPFDPLPNIPTGIFRCTGGEKLGAGAGANKCGCYQCPEYFSYHHMSYYDMHLTLRGNRQPSPKTGRKP